MITKATISISTILQADYFSRIRWSDISDAHNGVAEHVATLFYGAILAGFAILCGIYMWKAHKSVVKAIGKILLVCLVLFVIGFVANLVYEYNRRRPRAEKKTEQVTTVASDASASSVTPAPTTAHASTSVSAGTPPPTSTDSWDRYYPKSQSSNFADERKKNDFLVAAIYNPTFSIYDFMQILGMTAGNTQFLPENIYAQSDFVRNHFSPATFHQSYVKLTKAWQAFLRCQGVDINDSEIGKYMMHYDMFDIDKPRISDAANPQLIRDLQTIPLQ